jgi:hypothetical protein
MGMDDINGIEEQHKITVLPSSTIKPVAWVRLFETNSCAEFVTSWNISQGQKEDEQPSTYFRRSQKEKKEIFVA